MLWWLSTHTSLCCGTLEGAHTHMVQVKANAPLPLNISFLFLLVLFVIFRTSAVKPLCCINWKRTIKVTKTIIDDRACSAHH